MLSCHCFLGWAGTMCQAGSQIFPGLAHAQLTVVLPPASLLQFKNDTRCCAGGSGPVKSTLCYSWLSGLCHSASTRVRSKKSSRTHSFVAGFPFWNLDELPFPPVCPWSSSCWYLLAARSRCCPHLFWMEMMGCWVSIARSEFSADLAAYEQLSIVALPVPLPQFTTWLLKCFYFLTIEQREQGLNYRVED